MSNKKHKRQGKSNKGRKGGQRGVPAPAPVTNRKVVSLEEMLQRIYTKEDLSTTCLRQCTCCRVACPQMKFSEATSIIDHICAKWSKEEKKRMLVGCVKYFFSDSLIKPCLMLDGDTCRIYDRRPLNCRLYGLWPSNSWADRVAMFSKSTGLPKKKLPLNMQCPHVRRKQQVCPSCQGDPQIWDRAIALGEKPCLMCNGTGKFNPPPLTKEQISRIFEDLDKADVLLGLSELKVSTNWNYRTFHDWVLLKFWGEHTLAQWTNTLLATEPKHRHGLIEAVEQQAGKLI